MQEDEKINESLQAFGRNLRTACLRRGLAQVSVVAMAGVSLRTLQKLESGVPRIALKTLATVLFAMDFGTPFDSLCAPDVDERGWLLDVARVPVPVQAVRLNRPDSVLSIRTAPLASPMGICPSEVPFRLSGQVCRWGDTFRT